MKRTNKKREEIKYKKERKKRKKNASGPSIEDFVCCFF
jgi:hypothetical protein